MQKTTRVSLLGLAIAVLALNSPSALGGEMKPFRGWVMFPPAGPPDGITIAEYWDNVGGHATRVGQPTGPPLVYPVDPADPASPVVMLLYQVGTVTYPNGDQLFDECRVTVVLDATFQSVLGGSLDATITGGTGRLLGAQGWASVVEGSVDLPVSWPMEPGSVRQWFAGEISTVGSLQREQ